MQSLTDSPAAMDSALREAIGRSTTSRFRHLICSGISEPLSEVPFHQHGPIRRRRMCGQELHPQADLHVAVHEIRGAERALDRHYCEPHAHTCAELNLLISFERLVFRFTLGEESHICQAPASIFIPPGLMHCANVVEGRGFFVVFLGCGDYLRSLVSEEQSIPFNY
jgi:hypothetical protein